MKLQKSYYIDINKIIRNVIIIITVLLIFNMFIFPIIGKEDITTKTISVTNNDTLWNIASNLIENSENKNLNINRVIYEIKNLNNLEDSNIYVGQLIEVPLF